MKKNKKILKKVLKYLKKADIIVKTYAYAQLAVKWEVAETRESVAVSGSGFPMEQVYTKIIGERRLLRHGKRQIKNSFKIL